MAEIVTVKVKNKATGEIKTLEKGVYDNLNRRGLASNYELVIDVKKVAKEIDAKLGE